MGAAGGSTQGWKQILGERLYPLVARAEPQMAGKITGMLLEMDEAEIMRLTPGSGTFRGPGLRDPVCLYNISRRGGAQSEGGSPLNLSKTRLSISIDGTSNVFRDMPEIPLSEPEGEHWTVEPVASMFAPLCALPGPARAMFLAPRTSVPTLLICRLLRDLRNCSAGQPLTGAPPLFCVHSRLGSPSWPRGTPTIQWPRGLMVR